MQAMKRTFLRSTAVVLSVPLVVAALWLMRDATAQLSDTEVRHGVYTGAQVLDVDGDRATVRIPLVDDTIVATITRHGDYAVGDTVGVVYDTVDPARASELGAPAPSSPLTRGLVVGGLLVIVMAGGWLFLGRRPDVPVADEVGPRDVVRGGRELQPQLVR
jgi:hypothetical protein